MSILAIQQGANNPILRQKSKEIVDTKNPEMQRLILDMKDTVKHAQGLAIAAPQIGKNFNIFVIDKSAVFGQNEKPVFLKNIFGKKMPEVYINPKILKLSEKKELLEEGCLSLPGTWGNVLRHKEIEIEAQNEKGKKNKIKAKGLLAQVFQHEIDHLNGILFIYKV